MQELAHHVFIETTYAGVTLGAINWSHGLILIDSPFRAEDTRSWRSALLNLGGGIDRLLINLDAHLDRTLGTRGMDCTVLGHEKMAQVFRNRPITFKTQGNETGAEWELYNGLGSIRWAPPEITFSDRMMINWDDSSLVLEHHSGPAAGAIWVLLPEAHIALVGDAIVPNQPPFLGSADAHAWITSLEQLLTPQYRDYLLVSGRGGLVTHASVREQIAFLNTVYDQVEALARKGVAAEDTARLIPGLMARFNVPEARAAQYEQRLRYGLHHYFIRHYQPQSQAEEIEE